MTTSCWSCQGAVGGEPFCPSCDKIQPPRLEPNGQVDPYAMLGLSPQYHLDISSLEERFRAQSRRLHPDRFARRSPRERQYSLLAATELNLAYRTLRDDRRRAAYLLGRHGLPVGDDEGAQRRGPEVPASGGRRGVAALRLEPEFLMEVLELREALAEAQARGDHEAVARAGSQAEGRVRAELAIIAQGFARSDAGDPSGLGAAQVAYLRLRYFDRLLHELSPPAEASSTQGVGL